MLRDEADLAGLPDFVRAAARQAARERGVADGCVITLSRSHIVPFLTFSERRDLREQAWRAWTSRGEHAGAHDNRPDRRARSSRCATSRRGCTATRSYADYALADTMAGTPARGDRAARRRSGGRAKARAPSRTRGAGRRWRCRAASAATIEPWDWRYYAEKVRQVRYDLDEAAGQAVFPARAHGGGGVRLRAAPVRPALRRAAPTCAAYHPDVRVYEVRGADGGLVGVFLHDNFARPTKRSGAWMSSYRDAVAQRRRRATRRCCRSSSTTTTSPRARPGEPTLLSFDDARTLFHEFGHGLHGLLSNVTYERLSGTNVLRDFVELPSQMFEHWLDRARGAEAPRAPPPDRRADSRRADRASCSAARRFNQGYETVRYTASALVDMAVHAPTDAEPRRHRRLRARRARAASACRRASA